MEPHEEVNSQIRSILFSRLPQELRLTVWEYVLSPQPDLLKPYPENRFFYRPGYHFHPLTATQLLLSCKRVYHEARLLPIILSENNFWLFRGPTRCVGNVNTSDWLRWFRALNEYQRNAVQSVHFFAQQCNLESIGSWPNLKRWDFQTKTLTITFRHADWWSWESPPNSGDQLGICPWLPDRVSKATMSKEPLAPSLDYISSNMQKHESWGWYFGNVRRLAKLRIEFESVVQKEFQLKDVVERAKHWKFPHFAESDGSFLQWIGKLESFEWEGLANLREDYLPRNKNIRPDESKRQYHVKIMEWSKQNALTSSQSIEDDQDLLRSMACVRL